jgi:hypothetical protein
VWLKGGREVVQEEGEGEWVHEDSLDLRLIKTYRRTVVDEVNAEKARGWRRRKGKCQGRLRKLVGGFKKQTGEFWKGVGGEFVGLLL